MISLKVRKIAPEMDVKLLLKLKTILPDISNQIFTDLIDQSIFTTNFFFFIDLSACFFAISVKKTNVFKIQLGKEK